jgi:hypothetical protein
MHLTEGNSALRTTGCLLGSLGGGKLGIDLIEVGQALAGSSLVRQLTPDIDESQHYFCHGQFSVMQFPNAMSLLGRFRRHFQH